MPPTVRASDFTRSEAGPSALPTCLHLGPTTSSFTLALLNPPPNGRVPAVPSAHRSVLHISG